LKTRELSLGRLDPLVIWKTLKFSADGRHVAYVIQGHRPGRADVMPWETMGRDPIAGIERVLRG
jgi:hypothetical protein